MKRPGLISLSCAATLFLAAGLHAEETKAASSAATDAKSAPAPTMKPTAEDLLKRYDQNGDGRLDEDERAEMRKYTAEHGPADTATELVKRFDKDGDSKLNVEETTALLKFLRERQGATAGAVTPTPAQEAARKAAVETELARRRELREKGLLPPSPAAQEAERLEKVAADVARRRAEREKAAEALRSK